MNYPKITIVTPVYNQVKYLERTILSVLDQNYPNLEYIIVDGGSTDGTLEIIEKYRSKLFKVVSEKDNGMYDALDKGFRLSSGEIMAWLNADDMYHKNSLFIVAEVFEKFKEIEFLTGQPTTFDEQDRCVKVDKMRNWSKYDLYLTQTNWVIQQESTFWKRSLWERTGSRISKEYKLAGDSELWTRFLVEGKAKLYPVNALLAGFRVRPDQLSSNREAYAAELRTVFSKIKIPMEDQQQLKKILFYKNTLLKLPVLRSVCGWTAKYHGLFEHAPLIRYNSVQMKYLVSKLDTTS